MDSAFSAVRKKSQAIAVAVVLLGLVMINLLTLTDNSVHAKAYGFLESIARATVGVGVLQNSPTEVARRAVEGTRELRSQNEHLVSRNQDLLSENERVVLQKKNLAHRTLILVDAVNTLIAHTRGRASPTWRRRNSSGYTSAWGCGFGITWGCGKAMPP